MDRRTLLRGGLVGVGGVAVASTVACAPSPTSSLPGEPGGVDPGAFDCGVASGVHSDTAVVLWTRFAPAASGGAVDVGWELATEPTFTAPVSNGAVAATSDADGCVKVLAEGLEPGTRYWYRFVVDGRSSPVGRTRTLPTPGSDVDKVRFAVASCQNWSAGYYPAWRAIAAEDVDAVLFLGDYIYESSSTGARVDPTAPATDLASYRAKYRLYKSDPDLRAAHEAHPFAPVWDDHEVVNDYNRTTIEEFPERAGAAYRAWFEYQPVWPIDGNRIHRRLRWGRLVDLTMLDTRQYRDAPVLDLAGEPTKFGSTADAPLSAVHSPDRTLLGTSQRDWFLEGLGQAQADGVTWKLVANQVMISPIRAVDLDSPALRALRPDLPKHAGVYVNFDDWSGFMHERDLVTERLFGDGISNVGFLTGDIHSFWQAKVLRDFDEPGSPTVAQEFVCGSISSRGLDYAGSLAPEISKVLRRFNPGFRYVDLLRRGFGVVECRPDSTTVEFRTVNALSPNPASVGALPRRRASFAWSEGSQQVGVTRG